MRIWRSMNYEDDTIKENLLLQPGVSTEPADSLEKTQEKKRQRKEGAADGTVKQVVKQLSMSASSLEEVRRDQ